MSRSETMPASRASSSRTGRQLTLCSSIFSAAISMVSLTWAQIGSFVMHSLTRVLSRMSMASMYS